MGYEFVFADGTATSSGPGRLQVSGMPTLIRAMSIILDHDLARPRLEDMAARVCRRLDLAEPPRGRTAPGYEAFRAEWMRVTAEPRSRRSKNAARVPVFKFKTNEQWHVVPDECELIASHLNVYTTEGVSAVLLRTFVSFNRAAMAHQGFLVS